MRRIQTVTYSVPDAYSGYIADVTYSGEARYDDYKPAVVRAPYVAAPAPIPAPLPVVGYAPKPAYPLRQPAYGPAPFGPAPFRPAPYF
jgi:hypothetical protein